MNYEIKRTGPVLTKEIINNFEKENNISLPQDYIEFLLKNNGGSFIEDYINFDYKDKYGVSNGGVQVFYGINYPDMDYDLKSNIEESRNKMPNNIIPIIEDPAGNWICLSINGDDKWKVYLWDQNFQAEDEEIPDHRNLFLVANSFTEFFNLLKSLDRN